MAEWGHAANLSHATACKLLSHTRYLSKMMLRSAEFGVFALEGAGRRVRKMTAKAMSPPSVQRAQCEASLSVELEL